MRHCDTSYEDIEEVEGDERAEGGRFRRGKSRVNSPESMRIPRFSWLSQPLF